MFKVRLQLSYIGTPFCGWQNQKDHKNKPSVQYLLEKALSRIFHQEIHCVPTGRTDAGVHALAQNVHFMVEKDPRSLPLRRALRTLLPPSIVVEKAWIVPSTFNANQSALTKTYRYLIWNGETPSALETPFCYWYPKTLRWDLLRAYAAIIEGSHDFKTFQSASGRPPRSSVRVITKAEWKREQDQKVIFEITGEGFLRQMVRNLLATQLSFQEREQDPSDFQKLFEEKNRQLLGKPAPAQGLQLFRVEYPEALLAASEDLRD